MGSTFVIIGLIPLLVLIGTAAGAPLIILGLRQRAALRRARVNVDNPGCAMCLYIMRGWDSSICPECGADARTAGVRVGVHHNRFLKCLVALVGSGILTAAILWVVCSRLFAVQFDYEVNRYVTGRQGLANGLPAIQIQIQTQRELRRFPKNAAVQSALVIDPDQRLGPMVIATHIQLSYPMTSWPMMRPMPVGESEDWHLLYIAPDDQPPTEKDVLDLVNQALELDAGRASMVANEVYLLLNAHRSIPSIQISPSALSGTGGGSGQFKAIWWPGQVVMWVGTIATTLTFVIWVFRRHKPGIRAVEEGEWARTAPDSEAEPI